MTQRIRGHLSFANVTSLMALVFAMGGTGYALTLPKNSVGTKQIRKNAVTGAKVKARTLRASDFARGQLPVGPSGAPGAPGAPDRPALPGPPGPPGPPAPGACRASPAWWARSRWSARTSRCRTTRHKGSPWSAPRGRGPSAAAPRSPRPHPTIFTRRFRARIARGRHRSTGRRSPAGASRTATRSVTRARRPCRRSRSARRTSPRARGRRRAGPRSGARRAAAPCPVSARLGSASRRRRRGRPASAGSR